MGYEIDFLPVGKDKCGDAITARFGNLNGPRNEQTVIVVDGSFQDTGADVVKHVRAHYGTNVVDIVVSTHPDQDHIGGLETVIRECDVRRLWMHQPWKHTDDIARMFVDGRVTDQSVREALRKSLDEARILERLALAKNIPVEEPFTGLRDATNSVWVVGPSRSFYESLLPGFRGTAEAKPGLLKSVAIGVEEVIKKIAERFDFETLDDAGETSPENNSSAILLLVIDANYLLLTADAGTPALTQVVDALDAVNFDFSKLSFVQVPHHGSARNVGPAILNRLIGPRLPHESTMRTAFVSVTSSDHPKHPSKNVLNAFRRRGAPVHCTAGISKCHYYNAPQRNGWGPSIPLPFYTVVED